MPLSMQSEIAAIDIKSGGVLDDQWSVYKLVGWQDEALVIKVELNGIDAGSFTAAKRAMKQVDRAGARARLLTAREKAALREFAQVEAVLGPSLTNCRMAAYATGNAAPKWARKMGERLDAGLWYKMPLHDVAHLGHALRLRLQAAPDRGLLSTFLETLRGPSGLESLGMIVACDLINDNGDRFHPLRGVGLNAGGVDFQFRTLVNITNVFIAGRGTSHSVTGMDFVDPGSQYRFYTQTLDQVRSNSGMEWLGEHLIDTAKRRQFCRNIVHDLNLVFSAGNPNAPNRLACATTGTSKRPEERLELGMIGGGHQVRDGLRERYAKDKNRPAGLDSRLKRLDELPKLKAIVALAWPGAGR